MKKLIKMIITIVNKIKDYFHLQQIIFIKAENKIETLII